MRLSTLFFFFGIALTFTVGEAFAAQKLRIAVGEITAQGELPEELPAVIASVLADALAGLDAFDVISRQDVHQVLRMSQDRQLLGCEESDCYTEIATFLAADRLATGTVSKAGDDFVLSLVLVDLASGEIENRVSANVHGGRAALLSEVRRQAGFLVAKALAARSGKLVLRVDQEGANVEIDGKLVGVTPVGQLTVPGGYHALRVAKEGFVDWSRDIAIHDDDMTDLQAFLTPSADFADEYEREAKLFRGLAWGTLGLAAASGIATIVFKTQADTAADDLRNDVALVMAGQPAQGLKGAGDFESRKEKIDLMDSVALTSVIVTVLSGVASGLFFYTGEEPGRYEAYRTVEDQASN